MYHILTHKEPRKMQCVSEYLILFLVLMFLFIALAYLIANINKREALLKQLTIETKITEPKTTPKPPKKTRSKSLEPQPQHYPQQQNITIDIPKQKKNKKEKKQKKKKTQSDSDDLENSVL